MRLTLNNAVDAKDLVGMSIGKHTFHLQPGDVEEEMVLLAKDKEHTVVSSAEFHPWIHYCTGACTCWYNDNVWSRGKMERINSEEIWVY